MLEDLASQVEAIALLLAAYLFLWERSREGQEMFDESISDPNFLGATGRDAHLVWAAFRRELPLLLVVFFAPIIIAPIFLPPALEIIANVRPGRPYSPLRTAFLIIEAAWVTTAVLLGRRGLLLVRVARALQRDAADRWGSDQAWFRKKARKAAEEKRRRSTATEDRDKGGDDSG
jgi:hypothetical protein